MKRTRYLFFQNEANRDGVFFQSVTIRDSDNAKQTERKEHTVRKVDLQRRAVELIKQLSTEKLKTGVDYLTYLQDKDAWEARQELANDSEIAKRLKSKSTGKNPIVQRIVEAVENSQDVTLEDAEVLLQVIKENQMPVRFDSPFTANKQESQ